MTTQLKSRLVTAEEFSDFPDDCRYDLIRGELVDMPPMPGPAHGDTTVVLTIYAGYYVIENGLGRSFAAETRFTIERNPDTAIAPDWAFVATERLPAVYPARGYLDLAPDLVLEVRSPSDTEREAVAKMQRWMRAGVRLGWELNMNTRVLTVYRPNQEPRTVGIDGVIDGEDVLPGFTLPMRRLFGPQIP